MSSSENSFSREVLATGIAPEERESSIEGRDAIQELHDDLAVHLMLIAHARERVEDSLARLEEKERNEELKRTLYAAQEELARFEQKFFAVGAQAEIFATEEIKPDQHESVKLMQFRKLRDEFRAWWNVSAGIKNIFARVTHEFEDVKDFPKAVFAEGERERKQWYSRGFSKEVSEREAELADALKASDVALFNSGMSAIETILTLEGLKKGDAVVAAEHFYLHTGFLMDALAKRGVKVIRVPSGDLTALTEAISKHHPKLVLSEVVSNAPEMEVLPVRELFDFLAKYNKNPKHRQKPRLVLDNTFLTPELLDLLQEAGKIEGRTHLPLTVVESATKYYQQGLDNVTAGIAYANDPAYIQALKRKRAMIGSHLQENARANVAHWVSKSRAVVCHSQGGVFSV